MADYEIEAITETKLLRCIKLNYPQIMAKCVIHLLTEVGEPLRMSRRSATNMVRNVSAKHASRKEHNRAVQLKLLQRAGVISDFREQVPFELIPAQYAEGGYRPKG